MTSGVALVSCFAVQASPVAGSVAVAETETVTVVFEPEYPDEPTIHQQVLRITGTTGADALAVEAGGDGSMTTIRSTNDRLVTSASAACVQVSDVRVDCEGGLDWSTTIQVGLGAGDDSYEQYSRDWSAVWGTIGGGPGSDIVRVSLPAGHGQLQIRGGADDDTVEDNTFRPGEGRPFTILMGNDGDDSLFGGFVVEGNRGDDSIVSAYTESAYLYGNGGRDEFDSNGDDEIRGGGGADVIRDWDGDDVVYAGRGRDAVHVDEGGADDVHCGPGRDRVDRDWRDLLFRCEKVIRR